jgi:hypothetical protein
MAVDSGALVPASASAETGEPRAPGWELTTRGKGRLKPRRARPAAPPAPPPRLAAVAHADAERGEEAGDPPPRHPPWLCDGWVEYAALDGAPAEGYAALSALWEHRPVLLRGAPLAARLAGALGFDALAAAGAAAAAAAAGTPGTGEAQRLDVLSAEAARDRFFEPDAAKNLPGAPYAVRSPETRRLRLTLPEFVASARAWRAQRLLLKMPVLRHTPGGDDAEPPPPIDSAAGAALGETLARGLDWAWLAALRAAQRFGPVLSADLEAGGGGGLQPARYALHDSLLVQLTGRRRALLVPPEHAFAGAYPFPVAHPYDRYSMVDWEAPDTATWPKAAAVRGRAAVLRPGDALYVPAYWFLLTQELEGEGVAARLTLGAGARPPPPRAAGPRVARALEERVAAVEGPRGARRWLLAVARGAEGAAPAPGLDLATLAGYRRVVMCQGVRDEVDASLGAGAWATFLPAVCDGRLAPTPWLDAFAAEPLLLTSAPEATVDDRSEEERRFPALFRARLEARGWEVARSESMVAVPGYNC